MHPFTDNWELPTKKNPPPLPLEPGPYVTTESELDLYAHRSTNREGYNQQSLQLLKSDTGLQIPFLYHKMLECDSRGREYTIKDHDITLRIPKGAIPAGEKVHLELAVAMHGPFEFPTDVQPISPILWLCFKEKYELDKQFQVILPHYLTGLTREKAEYHQVCFAKADHTEHSTKDGQTKYRFEQIHNEPILASSGRKSFGVLLTNHCCFLCLQANYTADLVVDTEYCLARIESFIEQQKSEIHFSVVYCLDTCLEVIHNVFGLGHNARE